MSKLDESAHVRIFIRRVDTQLDWCVAQIHTILKGWERRGKMNIVQSTEFMIYIHLY